MPHKPVKWQDYLQWIQGYGWSLKKAGTDWSLLDENDNYVCTINKNKKKAEIPAIYVKKTKAWLKAKGLEQ